MKALLRRIPFTLVGVGILVFFEVVTELPDTALRATLISVARVLIVPSYLIWLAQSILSNVLGLGPVFAALGFPITFGLGLMPYLAADWFLNRHRKSRVLAA